MSNRLNVETEAERVIQAVRNLWGDDVSELKVTNMFSKPFDVFTIHMVLYGKFEVILEYDRETLGIKVNTKGQFIALSKLANKKIYRGFEGYKNHNLEYNLKVLDETLLTMK